MQCKAMLFTNYNIYNIVHISFTVLMVLIQSFVCLFLYGIQLDWSEHLLSNVTLFQLGGPASWNKVEYLMNFLASA